VKVSIKERLDEIMQAAEEIETATDAPLESCDLDNESERIGFIKSQAAEIIRIVSILQGYEKDGEIDDRSVQGKG
jgi:endonuclease III